MKEIDFILEFRRFVKDISKMGNVLGVRETMTKSERGGWGRYGLIPRLP